MFSQIHGVAIDRVLMNAVQLMSQYAMAVRKLGYRMWKPYNGYES